MLMIPSNWHRHKTELPTALGKTEQVITLFLSPWEMAIASTMHSLHFLPLGRLKIIPNLQLIIKGSPFCFGALYSLPDVGILPPAERNFL